METKSFTAIVQREGDGWVSLCPELDVASQGDTADEAAANLREAVELFLESASPDEVARRAAMLSAVTADVIGNTNLDSSCTSAQPAPPRSQTSATEGGGITSKAPDPTSGN